VLAPGKVRNATADQQQADPGPILVDQAKRGRLSRAARAASRERAWALAGPRTLPARSYRPSWCGSPGPSGRPRTGSPSANKWPPSTSTKSGAGSPGTADIRTLPEPGTTPTSLRTYTFTNCRWSANRFRGNVNGSR
jgi:hypothetical protein